MQSAEVISLKSLAKHIVKTNMLKLLFDGLLAFLDSFFQPIFKRDE